MLVYRVQHKDTEKGPYRNTLESYELKQMLNDHCSSDNHPAWMIDLEGFWTIDHLAGFRSLGKLLSWFAGYLDCLHNAGFVIVIYKVAKSDIIFSKSHKQLAFVNGIEINRINIPKKGVTLKRCHSCNDNALITTRYCLRCYVREVVRKTLKITEPEQKEDYTTQLLIKLHLQNFVCVYTARQLVPGKNMSLDHILPSSLFPHLAQDLDNLVWVDLSVNIAKNNLLPANFLQMCEEVVLTRSELLT